MAMIDFSSATLTPLIATYDGYDYFGFYTSGNWQVVFVDSNDSTGNAIISRPTRTLLKDDKGEFIYQISGSITGTSIVGMTGFDIWRQYSSTKYKLYRVSNVSPFDTGDTYVFTVKAQFDLS